MIGKPKTQASKTTLTFLHNQSTPIEVPLVLSSIKAGFPSPAEDYIEEIIDLNQHLIDNKEATFLAKVNGTSMENLGIFAGDIIVVDRSKNAKIGSTVVCAINNEFTLKTLEKDDESYYLKSHTNDKKNSPQKIRLNQKDDVTIWGVVTYVIHSLNPSTNKN